ncbi:MAG: tryptophanase [Candidatus Niyogibacteria bacterium]|nr:tryptophanase [Candidatus Niyogibacteria bacterium]
MKYPLEPFKYIVTEMLPLPTEAERKKLLEDASYNLFEVPADRVTLDLLTDSGTGAITREQQACSARGDESYAGSPSWLRRLKPSIQTFTGLYGDVVPVHQGRGAENVLADIYLNRDDVVLSNTLFDTTRGNFEQRGALCMDCPADEYSSEPDGAFKGNMNIRLLEDKIKFYKDRVKLIVLVATNNSGGGQPVSTQNIEAVSFIAGEHNIPFLLDACRIAENAFFIHRHSVRVHDDWASVPEIIQAAFRHADLAFMSLKKDGLAHMGGFIVVNRKQLVASRTRAIQVGAILKEGFKTYGGMSGKDMEIAAQGLREVVNPVYLRHRVGQVEYLHAKLKALGYPLVEPAGGHGVFIDAKALLPHIPPEQFPGHALAVAFYEKGGIRGVEVGSLMFGENARREFLRLAIPRLMYTENHMGYVAAVAAEIFNDRHALRGFQIIEGADDPARHFSCKLKPL